MVTAYTGDLTNTLAPKGFLQRFESASLVVEISQVVVHAALTLAALEVQDEIRTPLFASLWRKIATSPIHRRARLPFEQSIEYQLVSRRSGQPS
jgi:hypothetical protein